MTEPNFVLLYVQNPRESATFYQQLLERAPVESSATFAMFALSSGVMLGLWARDTVAPNATPAGGSELAFAVADAEAVRATHLAWQKRGLAIVQSPTELDFGFTFVASDPDGHRLRVFAPGAP